MKTLLLVSLLLTSSAFAQEYSKKELVQMSLERLYPDGVNKDKNADMSDIVDEWNKLFDAQHLKSDKNKNRVDWTKAYPIQKDRLHRIEGKRIFYGMIPKTYRYDILEDARNNQLIVRVKMHFYPSKTYLKRSDKLHASNHPDKKYYPQLPELMKQVRKNVQIAENMWQIQSPPGVSFRFEMVDKKEDAHYSVKLVTTMGALYDKFITAPAYADILAHEAGHMMGLDDEYAIVSNVLPINSIKESIGFQRHEGMDYSAYKDMRCNLESIMCLRETVYHYHLDHILGRIPLR